MHLNIKEKIMKTNKIIALLCALTAVVYAGNNDANLKVNGVKSTSGATITETGVDDFDQLYVFCIPSYKVAELNDLNPTFTCAPTDNEVGISGYIDPNADLRQLIPIYPGVDETNTVTDYLRDDASKSHYVPALLDLSLATNTVSVKEYYDGYNYYYHILVDSPSASNPN
jgi:hypothetical protein